MSTAIERRGETQIVNYIVNRTALVVGAIGLAGVIGILTHEGKLGGQHQTKMMSPRQIEAMGKLETRPDGLKIYTVSAPRP